MMVKKLFKGRRIDNGEWIEGYFCHKYFADIPHDRCVIQYEPKLNSNKWTPPYLTAEVDPETVEYTGATETRAEAVKEFAERLKETSSAKKYNLFVTKDDIDNLVKEMVGEQQCQKDT